MVICDRCGKNAIGTWGTGRFRVDLAHYGEHREPSVAVVGEGHVCGECRMAIMADLRRVIESHQPALADARDQENARRDAERLDAGAIQASVATAQATRGA